MVAAPEKEGASIANRILVQRSNAAQLVTLNYCLDKRVPLTPTNALLGDQSCSSNHGKRDGVHKQKPVDYTSARRLTASDSLRARKSLEEYTLGKVKERLLKDWHPEYEPESVLPPHECRGEYTLSERATLIQLEDITQSSPMTRKTKILCTLGPACMSEDTIGELLDAGLNIARLNFSHGSHESQLAMLSTYRKVCAAKGVRRAALLDTKGPEIRTAMLRDGENIQLEQGQDIIVEAVGDKYTEFQGYKTPEETRIGLSYDKLCTSVSPGNRILIADGTISIEVVEILTDTELRGRVLNTKELGQRKNCNLPGVKVELPVLMDKDIADLQNFACKHDVDFVAASFVQSADDVRFVRQTLDNAGGHDIKIICKIENMAGLENFDEILQETDGIMVARGDLGMEIPSEKVPLAQKMMITKCNVAGKFVICATQMLESMIVNPLPTRAEMTDVANAVYDGTDAVMLSGETANGHFPAAAVATMADIVSNAEVGVDYYKQYNFIRYWSTKRGTAPVSAMEAVMSSAAKMAVLYNEDTDPHTRAKRLRNAACIVCVTATGMPAQLITKYRPPAVVFVASTSERVIRQANASFGMYGLKLDSLNVTNVKLAEMARERLFKISPGVKINQMGKGMKGALKSVGVALTTPAGTPLQTPGTRSLRSTRTNLNLISKALTKPRSTRIVCTLGPACWDEASLMKLLEAGCDVVRLNFSHGDHGTHSDTLARFRKVCDEKAAAIAAEFGVESTPKWAVLLDTKGPEIRMAMLKNGENILLEKDQKIIVEAVGDRYTEFEGYKTADETRIGLSYAKLCKSLSPGDRILIGDGTIGILVDKILSDTELQGTVLNTKELGQRKNCNLPGVKVDLPVLTEKDVHDLKEFACKHRVDYVAASFVQSAADVRFIRSVLDEAAGFDIKIISKIENEEGLNNFAEILQETDGIMVARGDLGMEIPSSKVPLAQKMMITQCNLAAKFVICATQMLESMIKNPLPTRAEMTDVANAVLDGADAVMLSGETANGSFADTAVSTMSAICQNAEQMVDQYHRYDFIRSQTPAPLDSAEAVCSSAVQMALDMKAKALVCFTTSGRAAQLLCKYRPSMPVFVVSPEPSIIRGCRSMFGLIGVPMDFEGEAPKEVTNRVVEHVRKLGLIKLTDGDQLVVVHRRSVETGNVLDDQRLAARSFIVGDGLSVEIPYRAYEGDTTIMYRSTKIGLDTLLDPEKFKHVVRKSKIVCTLGPACFGADMLGKLLDAGLNIARFNFSHGSHESHLEVLERFRGIAAERKANVAVMLDTKGPEIRTAMLRGGANIQLEKGQDIVIEAVGEKYTEFEGYKTAEETRIGLSYGKLCQSIKPGNKILLADGTITIEVVEILTDTELRGRVLNTKELGQRKNCNLPGVKIDLPVLMPKDVDDLQNFAAKHAMDFVAASFVQSRADVEFIRRTLDEAGGEKVGIICKIENSEGLRNYDDILAVCDGIMVARGDLGMEIPVQKVPLAQKMMITKANIAGRFVICATQMMESMIDNPYPTRAEMTDVANAVFDGADAVMLSGETANGKNPDVAVSVMASICQHAEIGVNHAQTYNFIRSFTPKPVGTVEAVVSTMAKNAVDIRPGMLIVFSESGKMARLIAKYRPCAPVLVVTSNAALTRRCAAYFACYTMLLDKPMTNRVQILSTLKRSLTYGVEAGICVPGKEVAVLASTAVTASGVGQGAERELFVTVAPGRLQFEKLGTLAPNTYEVDDAFVAKTISLRASRIDLEMLFRESAARRKTKIMATVGPHSSDGDTIRRMVQAGMDCLRINLAHANETKLDEVVAVYRSVCAELHREPCICVDLQGSELRSCWLIDKGTKHQVESIQLTAGQAVTLYGSQKQDKDSFVGWTSPSETRLGVGFPKLATVAPPETIIRFADGSVCMEVVEVLGDNEVKCVVASDCTLGSHKMVSITDLHVHLPFLNPKDRADVKWAAKQRINYIAASFTRSADNIEELRELLHNEKGGDDIKIIAKVEDADGLKNLDEILDACEGVMVARGDLGLEISPEKVALAQNFCVTKTNIRGKISIVSRQMLESMVYNPRPTRAEMTDVANAAFDGADCVMLGDETAIGAFPVEAVETMSSILRNAEDATNYYAIHSFVRDFSSKPFTSLEAASACLAKTSMDTDVAAVVTYTHNGDPAAIAAKFRPEVPQIVVSDSKALVQQSALYFGMVGVFQEGMKKKGLQESLQEALGAARARGMYDGGAVAVVHGQSALSADMEPVMSIVNPEKL